MQVFGGYVFVEMIKAKIRTLFIAYGKDINYFEC